MVLVILFAAIGLGSVAAMYWGNWIEDFNVEIDLTNDL